MATASQINEIIKLYVGYYNRAPDPVGLNFWIAAFDGGFSLDAMADDFSTQPETLKNYPFFLNADPSQEYFGSFVDSVYQNLFNRNPDDEGKAFWVGKLDAGEFSVGQVISLIIEGATTSPDQDVVANKVAVGLDFYTETNALPPYVFDEDDVVEATAIQAGVTEDPATIATAAARTDAYVEELQADEGKTINLTTNTDLPGGSGTGTDTQGGSGKDTYEGTVEQGGNGTLQNGDSLAAGGGEDTLNVRLVSSAAPNLSDVVSLNATDLENINVTNQVFGSSQFLLDIESVTGEVELTATGGNTASNTVFGNADMGTALRMIDVEGAVGVSFKGDQMVSGNDSFDLYIEDSGSAEDAAIFQITDDNLNGANEDFEIGNIVTGGTNASFLNLEGLALNQINVSGAQKLHLEDRPDGFEELEAIDASAMTGGGISIDVRGADDSPPSHTSFAFTGSDFDDALFLQNEVLSTSSSLSLDAGDGTDTLMVSNFVDNTVASINRADGFEVLESQNSSSALVADDYDEIDTFVFTNQSTNGDRLNVRGVTDDDLFIFESDAGRTDEFIRFEANSVGQSLTFEMRATAEDDGQIEFVAQGNGNSASAIGFTGNSSLEDVTIISSGTNEDANLIQSLGSNGNFFAFDNANGPTNFSITGGQALTITAAEGVELTSSDKERGFAESVNLDGSAATGDLRVAGSAVNDAIEGGSGDDILYGLGGDDVLTGNDGADQFRFANWSGVDEIIDFVSGEDVVGLNRTDFGNTTATFQGAVLNADDYVENLQTIANISNAEENKIVELQSAVSQTQLEDTIIQTGTEAYVMAFNSTSARGELWFDADWSNDGGRQHVATFEDINSLVELTGFTNNDFVEYLF